MIEKYGFRKAIEDLVYAINLSEKISLETVIVGFDNTTGYPVTLLHTIYSIILELLNNIIKHSEARHAIMELIEHEHNLSLMVEDDGVGIADIGDSKGKGLAAIQSKTDLLNGKMEISRKKDHGTLIIIEIPFQSPI